MPAYTQPEVDVSGVVRTIQITCGSFYTEFCALHEGIETSGKLCWGHCYIIMQAQSREGYQTQGGETRKKRRAIKKIQLQNNFENATSNKKGVE